MATNEADSMPSSQAGDEIHDKPDKELGQETTDKSISNSNKSAKNKRKGKNLHMVANEAEGCCRVLQNL